MGKGWTFLLQLHSVAGPVLQLLYPLYASVMAIESTSKLDDEQWLAYWIIYSFLTLLEMVIQPALEWLPIWYEVKLVFVAWLVLPQFKGAAFLYEKYVREQILKRRGGNHDSSSKSRTGKDKNKVYAVHDSQEWKFSSYRHNSNFGSVYLDSQSLSLRFNVQHSCSLQGDRH